MPLPSLGQSRGITAPGKRPCFFVRLSSVTFAPAGYDVIFRAIDSLQYATGLPGWLLLCIFSPGPLICVLCFRCPPRRRSPDRWLQDDGVCWQHTIVTRGIATSSVLPHRGLLRWGTIASLPATPDQAFKSRTRGPENRDILHEADRVIAPPLARFQVKRGNTGLRCLAKIPCQAARAKHGHCARRPSKRHHRTS